jgi:hypothetical protein
MYKTWQSGDCTWGFRLDNVTGLRAYRLSVV